MPKYIIQNGKAIRVDKIPKPEVKKEEPKEPEVVEEVEEKAFDEARQTVSQKFVIE